MVEKTYETFCGNCKWQEEQIMYPCSLEHERFIVALVNSGSVEDDDDWEITQALKSD